MTTYNDQVTVKVTKTCEESQENESEKYFAEIYLWLSPNYFFQVIEDLKKICEIVGYYHIEKTVPVVASYTIRYRIFDNCSESLDAIKEMLKTYCKFNKFKYSQIKSTGLKRV